MYLRRKMTVCMYVFLSDRDSLGGFEPFEISSNFKGATNYAG